MSVVLSGDVLDVGLVKELVAVVVVAQGSQADEHGQGHHADNDRGGADADPVQQTAEDVRLLGGRRGGPLGSLLGAEVDTDREGEEARVDLQVDCQAEEKAGQDKAVAEEEINDHNHGETDDRIGVTAGGNGQRNRGEEPKGGEAESPGGSAIAEEENLLDEVPNAHVSGAEKKLAENNVNGDARDKQP